MYSADPPDARTSPTPKDASRRRQHRHLFPRGERGRIRFDGVALRQLFSGASGGQHLPHVAPLDVAGVVA